MCESSKQGCGDVGGVFLLVWWCLCGVVLVFLWCCGVFCGGGFVGVVVFVWWCFFAGVVVFLWWCFCAGVFVLVFFWLCFCGGVFVLVFVRWCFCGVFVVAQSSAEVMAVFQDCHH